MDRWIQDRDRLSKQLEKCQMKYDNATVLQKVVLQTHLSACSQIFATSAMATTVYIESFQRT